MPGPLIENYDTTKEIRKRRNWVGEVALQVKGLVTKLDYPSPILNPLLQSKN